MPSIRVLIATFYI